MRLMGYVRTSTSKQEISPQAQEDRIRAYCELYGHVLVDVVSEVASGKDRNRRGLQLCLSAPVDGVVVHKLDRLTRNLSHLLDMVSGTFQDRALISVTEQLDTTTPNGRFCLTIWGAMAQWERETISARTVDALASLKDQGRRYSRIPPYGWQWVDGLMVPNLEERAQIDRARALRNDGLQYSHIADKLESEGYRNRRGNKRCTSSVYRIINA